MISSAAPDQNGHIRGGNSSCPGNSGGPIFDYYSGEFIGIAVGNQLYHDEDKQLKKYGSKCNIVPANLLQ